MLDQHLARELLLATCGNVEVDLQERVRVPVENGRRPLLCQKLDVLEPVDVLARRRREQDDALDELTPGDDINWLEDIALLVEDGSPAVFDRYSNSFLKIYFPIPEGREDEIARKVLMKHLTSGNSYGIQLKHKHAKFPQPELGPWVAGSATVGEEYAAPVLEGWEKPAGH